MSDSLRKIFAVVTSVTMAMMLVGPVAPAQAMTAEELQAQIVALQAQLAALTSQLNTVGGGSTVVSGAIAACAGIASLTRNLAQGMSGADVKCAQGILNADPATQIASVGAGSPGYETTFFGGLTKVAVVKFQNKYAAEVLAPSGLTAGTGYVGSATRAKMNTMIAGGGGTVTPPPSGGGGTVTPPPVATGAGLTVALADDNTVAGTIVADNTGATDSAQSSIAIIKVKLTNGDSSAVKLTQIKLTRSGISADSDIANAYLYEGDTLVAEYSSFSLGVLTFSSAAGIVSIPAGGSKVLTLKVDLTNNTGSGKTIRFAVTAATDVTSDASAVKGTYPVMGNYMSTAVASDLGQMVVASSTSPSSTVDPQNNFEMFTGTLNANDQKMELRLIKFTNTGSVTVSDLANFKLYDGATQIGTSVAAMASDKTVTFDLTGSPLVIDKGITKTLRLKGDIVAGTSRTFQFSIQNQYDIIAYDTQYGVFTKPHKSGSQSWTVFSMTASTINTGKLTATRATDSPSSNVPLSGTNILLGKFDVKATGEDVKITEMNVRVYGTVSTNGLYQGKVVFDGSQKGSTTNLNSAATDVSTGDTTFTFGNTLIVPAGTTKTLEVRADIKKSAGTAYSGNETITVKLSSVTATGRTSLQSVSVGAPTGYLLTVKTGTLSAVKNQTLASWSSGLPTGVPGASQVLIGSFVITAGAAESADITAVKITDGNASNVGFEMLQNLNVYKGTNTTGVKIGDTQSSLTKGSSYTFYPSPYITLGANESATISLYADILTSASTTVSQTGKTVLDEVNATGKTTNTDISYTTNVDGQVLYVSSAGDLTVAAGDNQVSTGLRMTGATNQEFTKLKFTAGAGEAVKVTKIVVHAVYGGGAPTSTIAGVSLWDGATQVGTTQPLDAYASSTFNLDNLASLPNGGWIIPAGAIKTLTIKADVNNYAYASSGATVALRTTAYDNAITAKGVMSGTAVATSTIAAVTGNTMTIYRSLPYITVVAQNNALLGTSDLLTFKVKADANSDGIDIYGFNFGVNLTDYATASDLYLSNITLYKLNDSTALNTTVSTSTNAGAYATASIAVATFGKDKASVTSVTGDIRTFATTSAGATTSMISLGGGEEVTFVLKATVSNIGVNDQISVNIQNISTSQKNAIVWGDKTITTTPFIDATSLQGVPTNSQTTK
jgi:hypothetical protein